MLSNHTSEDLVSTFETRNGGSPWTLMPSDGGSIPVERQDALPYRLIIVSGVNDTELATFGTGYFSASTQAKEVLEKLDPRFDFYPLEVVDRPKRTVTKKWLLHPPHRVQAINLEATGDALIVEKASDKFSKDGIITGRKRYRVRSDAELVLDRHAIEGLHLWGGISTSLVGYWFCSEAFKEATEPFRRSFAFNYIREA